MDFENIKIYKVPKLDGYNMETKLTYKDVEIDSGRDLMTMVAQKMANNIETQCMDGIYKCTQKFGVVANEEKIKKWVKMCQFLEESATDEDKKAIGVLINIKHLGEQLEAKDRYIEQLIAKNRKLEDRIETAMSYLNGGYNDDDWGDDD